MSLEKRKQELENYLYGRMSEEKAKSFLHRLRTMVQLRDALMAYTPPPDAPEKVESRLQELRQEYGGPQPPEWRVINPKLAAIWGIIALVVILGWNFFYADLHYSDEALAQYYYAAPDSTQQTGLPPALEKAVQNIGEEKYAPALETLGAIGRESGDYPASLFWQAHIYFQKQDYQQALQMYNILLEMSRLPAFADRQRLEWNRLLARLGSGHDEQPIRRKLTLFSESEAYPPFVREAARNLESDLSSLYHQLFIGSGDGSRASY